MSSAVQNLKESLRLAGAVRLTTCVWGHRGIGKSNIIAQVAQEGIGEVDGNKNPLPMGLVDLRCSQLEASDIRGLPSKKDGRTFFLPPAELPVGDMSAEEIESELAAIEDEDDRAERREHLQVHYKHGILFLDEINRAQDDVLQAVFQLLLDMKVGKYVLPAGWRVVVACNFMEGDYITNGFNDAALLDRMCHLTFTAGEGTVGDWSKYMADRYGEHASACIEYCASNPDHLVGKVSGELGFTVQPSPRSWEWVAKIEKTCESTSYSPEARFAVVSGLIGQAAAITYREYSCPVKPHDILAQGVGPFRKKLLKLQRNELLSITWGMVACTRGKLDSEDVVNICLDLAELLLKSEHINDKDVIIGFCRALMEGGDDLSACLTNRELAKSMLEFYSGDQVDIFVKCLYEREDLHQQLSTTGWGAKSSAATV